MTYGSGGATARQGAPSWLSEVPLAHRGLHGAGVPENSLPAFDAACEVGVGIELDVRVTADGVPVVSHDRDLRHSIGDPRLVAALTWEELEGLRLVDSDEGMPTLAAALDVVAGRVPVMVEVKNEGARAGKAEAAAAAVLEGRDAPMVVASFNPMTVRWFSRHLSHLPRVQTGGSHDVVPRFVRPMLGRMIARGVGDPVALSWDVNRLDDLLVTAARAVGTPVVCWTVRTPADLENARAGADNVIFEMPLTPDDLRASP